MGILWDELPPKIVAYDKPTIAVKPYTQCSEKVSECPMSNAYSWNFEKALQE